MERGKKKRVKVLFFYSKDILNTIKNFLKTDLLSSKNLLRKSWGLKNI
jgi:hypothetical protein